MNKVLIWGGKSKARIILKMIEDACPDEIKVMGVFDRTLEILPFQSNLRLFSSKKGLFSIICKSTHFVCCIGGEFGYLRYMISKKLEGLGLTALNVISPYAVLDDVEEYGDGLQIMPGAIVHKFCRLGQQCIINTNATVDHECVIGNGVHVMGGASIAGRSTIGDFATIGTNATILPGIIIGKGAYVGAGAVVNKNVKDFDVVAGVPAKSLRRNVITADLSIFD